VPRYETEGSLPSLSNHPRESISSAWSDRQSSSHFLPYAIPLHLLAHPLVRLSPPTLPPHLCSTLVPASLLHFLPRCWLSFVQCVCVQPCVRVRGYVRCIHVSMCVHAPRLYTHAHTHAYARIRAHTQAGARARARAHGAPTWLNRKG